MFRVPTAGTAQCLFTNEDLRWWAHTPTASGVIYLRFARDTDYEKRCICRWGNGRLLRLQSRKHGPSATDPFAHGWHAILGNNKRLIAGSCWLCLAAWHNNSGLRFLPRTSDLYHVDSLLPLFDVWFSPGQSSPVTAVCVRPIGYKLAGSRAHHYSPAPKGRWWGGGWEKRLHIIV